jgi:D-3-phosphoglycerate dehydrogenase
MQSKIQPNLTPVTSYPKEKINILFLENISPVAVKRFTDNGYIVKSVSYALPEDKLIEEIKNVHLLGIRSKTQITKNVLDAAKKLQAIGCFCIGVNQVDLQYACQKGIAVFNSPYSNTRSVAELVIGLCIMLIRKIPDKNLAAHKQIWMKDAKNCYELRGKTLGIIGYGNIGSQVSIMAEGMGMKVIYHDIVNKLPLGNAQLKTLGEVLSSSDIITLHVPESKCTENMINTETIKQMKKGTILLNYARGNVVDLDALSDAIKTSHISGAAIDVFPTEPEKNGDIFECPLQNLPNVILTPHIGGSTEEAQYNIGLDVSNKLFQFLEMGISLDSCSIPSLMLSPQEGTHRILHIHKNVPGVLSEINSQLSTSKINVVSQFLKTNNDVGYVVLDIDQSLSSQALKLLKNIKETIKVRLLY